MAIVFFNAALCRFAFSTVSFRKLVFHLSVPSLNQDIKICVIMLCNFVLTLYKNSRFINNKLFIKILQNYVKTCFQRCFGFFKKNSFIKKSVKQSKIKSVKNIIIKKVSYETFSSMFKYSNTIAPFWNLALVLALHCYCGDTDYVKYGLLSKHLFQRKRQYGGWKNLTVTTNF